MDFQESYTQNVSQVRCMCVSNGEKSLNMKICSLTNGEIRFPICFIVIADHNTRILD